MKSGKPPSPSNGGAPAQLRMANGVAGDSARPTRLSVNSFLDSYNTLRHKAAESLSKVKSGQIVKFAREPSGIDVYRTARSMESSRAGFGWSARTARTPRKADYAYMPIRSDVDDEAPGAVALPGLPTSVSGLSRPDFESRLRNYQSQLTTEAMQGPMAWVESTWFQMLSGLVIFANSVIIGLETDIDTPMWFWIEQALLIFFVFELSARLLRNGFAFFHKEDEWVWNLFDFSIVASGIVDTWLMPLLFANLQKSGSHMSVVFMLMRMGRLLRIVRLFRLVRIVRPLFELAMGIMEALQGMFWVLVFMIMTLYAAAILCTRLIGHGTIITENDSQELLTIKDMFSSVDKSMFTLFGTVSSWSLLKFVPLFSEMPALRPMFVLFYVYSAWALLAVMAGVVSKNMIAIRDQMVQEDKQKEDMRRANITEHLLELFRKADEDNSGQISREEFDNLMCQPEVVKKIQKNTNMRTQDLSELFDLIDHDESNNITIDEFMSGFKWVNEPLRQKSLVRMQQRLGAALQALESSVVTNIESKAEIVRHTVTAPLRKVYAITEQLQNLDSHLDEVWTIVRDHAASLPTPKELEEVEDRLSLRVDGLLERIQRLETTAVRRPAVGSQ
eukprot:TRINITY_DN4173_c2_g3_i1.p1 TRINITY_DN4173_c2_g3~~TRINITY_DN4173_c2_g3_i1.p1  ORF type:complete len:642 (+),score=143.56 TRINITY_DN4173_c2_g3_i1:78-1928(+)